ncbi:sigma-54-dependent Fis family transcriptional regulator [Chitinophaga agrisoli]|uniref:Sigma-54-dependent Fis family transcriptional regulator n=1 Tax=Chitinophaga agrisoli TaxID=2607653 RepID=A0A5B2VIW7_9BACT|nr:sigma-54 dependent transcriptional regulator [Chitinophaga agrisoli]KAA2239011.1 sigma-54-dependent Fis family transcriptional regulator [Chitinophaga agrisoli]
MMNILIVDDEINICTLLNKILTGAGYLVDTTLSGLAAVKMVKEKVYDLVFCDYRLRDKEKDGASLMEEIRGINPHTKVVIMTGYPDVRIAIRLIKEGAFDYLLKPFNRDQILALVKTMQGAAASGICEELPAIELAAPATAKAGKPVVVNRNLNYIYGESQVSKQLYEHIHLVAPTDYSIIITGETGVGKEAVARLVHVHSKRCDYPFVALDCGCLSDELASSELFGHEKGAFTGAINSLKGAFEQAQGGTLFLDEVTNLSYAVQVALLRVIQERVVRPVGSLKEIPVDIRLVVASNENLQEAALAGKFRQDLFFRLNEFSITVPPLRTRLQDLPLFIANFLKEIGEELAQPLPPFSHEAQECMYRHTWPGNIRELKNVVRRACLLAAGEPEIPVSALPPDLRGTAVLPEQEPVMPDALPENLKSAARQAEYQKIISVMKTVRYNKTKAAQLLNIDRKTLYNKLNMFNIEL